MDKVISENIANKQTNKKNEVQGFIDAIHSGFIHGWAHDPNEQNKTAHVSVAIEGKTLTKATANEFRPDVKDAGISDGYSGFKIPIDEIVKDHINKEIQILVNNKLIPSTKQKLILNDGFFWFGFKNIENTQISASIISEKFNGEKNVYLFIDDECVSNHLIQLKEGQNDISLSIPIEHFSGSESLIRVGVEGFPFALWTNIVLLPSLSTPWEYLKDSYKEPGFTSLSNTAKHRYESLSLQLDNTPNNNANTYYKNIKKAHDIVVEGHINRKKFPKLTLPKVTKPIISIIIPAYNKFELTYHAIASIILAYNETSYEVIVADDCSSDETQQITDIIENVVHIRNQKNLRFLLSCNNAAKYCHGEFIIFLNNDTEVTSFWLDELIKPFEDKTVGATGAKLLNTDGSLQDAGGIIWGSGQPWNVGNGSNVLAPEYNYTRQADYLTGAALCVKKSVWDEVNGFSKEFAPCYYEDTDIAFKIRHAGYKTLYIPFAQVIHFEGQSHGKDVTKGLKQYQKINESTFKSKWFKEYKNNGEEGKELQLQKDRNIDHRILVIDYATPNAQTDAGSYAAVEEIKLLIDLGIKVTFVPENLAHMGKLTTLLQRLGVEVLYAPFYTSVFDVIEKRINEFNGIYITRYSVAEKYLDAIRARTKAKIIFNNADLHFLRELRAVEATGEYSLDHALETRSKELKVISEVDAILSYNETEHAVIQSHNLKADNIFKCPWVLYPKKLEKPFEQRKDIAFLGGFRHHPNVKAVQFFAKEVMPLITKVSPDIKFYIYGSNPSQEVIELASNNIIIKGFVENLDDVFTNHRIIVAPLLSGAGIKGKVLEAMSYGCPQVLTSVAAEATGLSHKISTWIGNEPQEIAQGIEILYKDKALWQKFSENSRILVEEMYSKDQGMKMMKQALAHIEIYTQ